MKNKAQFIGKSPTGGYAPGQVQCPANSSSFIREANSISKQEQAWIKQRKTKTKAAMIKFLESANLTNFNAANFLDDSDTGVNLGLAFSGGGYRAMLTGAGSLLALDDRNNAEDGLGGILQSANYIGGLSGASWFLGSLVLQDWPSVDEVVFQNPNDLWNFTSTRQLVNQNNLWTIIFPVLFNSLNGALSHINFWSNNKQGIKYDIQAKEKAGFETSVVDAWGRGLAHQLFPPGNDNYGSDLVWSDIRGITTFANHDMPFPFVTSLGRRPGTVVYNLNSTVIEMNPFEFGSFDPSLNSFTDIKYLGTSVNNGVPNGTCINGFDNGAFIMGSSSSLFNQFLNTLVCDDCNSLNFIVKYILKWFLTHLSRNYEDVALYKPNPFYQSQYSKSDNITHSDTLYLIDGGIGGEIIPLSTLMTTQRKLDVVFAFDNSNDNLVNFPNGQALINSYERQFSNQGKSTLCPYVPDINTFLEGNLTAKPTFFGCDAKNLTALEKDGVIPPIVVYFANRPYEFYSNVSTFQLSFTDDEKKSLIRNGFDVASRLNGTIDPNFKTCIACALIRREEERRDIEQSEQCKQCFQDYCWDGTYYPGSAGSSLVNFTASGLTNDAMVYYGTEPPTAPPGFSIFKRENSASNADIHFLLKIVLYLVVPFLL
ncbi:phospholipase B [Spathaspora passalidarum NRRL Y-27907]|uniref:Lysophospholipase n=1 Tax=Spathaspora passalidarum (strain NRRL Y-27907 / 11-Y1) TaxID=619300 RepID=G3AMT2_SPAPN|nr:phospholipase B [Spathaspora passalidarum NRRL Y-27907]EGW33526.1 phospholipase B [Spathaspora passalidarum NRRL Y-27907]